MKLSGNRVVWLAVSVSVLVHLATMLYVRSKVMTHSLGSAYGHSRRGPMTMAPLRTDVSPVSLSELLELDPLREAPAAKAAEPPRVLTSDVSEQELKVRLPKDEMPAIESETPPLAQLETPAFDLGSKDDFTLPSGIDLGLPAPAADLAVLPPPSVETAQPAPLPEVPNEADLFGKVPEAAPERLPSAPVSDFTPASDVLEKVDRQVVEAEKAAVRALIDSGSARELAPFVSVRLAKCEAADGTYFRATVTPKADLRPVPKDLVVIIDASGSIGASRMPSIRKATRRLLRSATNSGDRFNLVAFRDRYSYAFRSWQPCTQTGYDNAERWLRDLAAQGRTDVFGTIESVLRLPRDPARPLVALVVTDGDANEGVSDTEEIISQFTELNDGLVSVYMYGVKSASNRALVERLTRANRGESFIFEGASWDTGDGLEALSERFRDPVLSDLRLVFAADQAVDAYPRLLRNLCRGRAVTVTGRVPRGTTRVSFSLKGLNGAAAFESYFSLPLATAATEPTLPSVWREERRFDLGSRKDKKK